MNLLEIFEENKKREEIEKQQEEERNLKGEIRKIKAEIILGKKCHYSDNEKLLKDMNIKYKKGNDYFNPFTDGVFRQFADSGRYSFEYNKTNIKKIQDYIDKN